MGEGAPLPAQGGLGAQAERLAPILFGSEPATAEEEILLRMSLREADPGLARVAELLGARPELVRMAFLGPMLRWGASETYEPMRQHERALLLAAAVRSSPYFCIPVAMWPRKPARLPSRSMRALFWAMAMASSPLSFFGGMALAIPLSLQSSIPEWLAIALAAALPAALGKIERGWLLRRRPGASLAHWIARRFFAPPPSRLDQIAQAARACFFERSTQSAALGAQLRAASFRAGGSRAASGLVIPEELDFVCLDILLAELAHAGMAPGVDAALAALASQESEALAGLLPPSAPAPRARPRSL